MTQLQLLNRTDWKTCHSTNKDHSTLQSTASMPHSPSTKKTTTDQLRRWAELIDTGAITSVASREHFTHRPLKPLRKQDPQTLTAVNGEETNIYGIKQVTLVQYNLAIPATFIISDVNCAMLGLDTIAKNKLQLRAEGYRGHLARDHAEVKLDYIENHST
eukprot:6490595-Amphidinium_carterae.2